MGSFYQLTYHIVFSTRYRLPIIESRFRESLYKYIGGVIRGSNGHLIEIGGIADHVHILASFSATKAVSDTIRDIKANSSTWMNEQQFLTDRFEWQKGYGAFTVSHSQIDVVRTYIQNQEEHHRKSSFVDEYTSILKRHGIETQLKYLFDGERYG